MRSYNYETEFTVDANAIGPFERDGEMIRADLVVLEENVIVHINGHPGTVRRYVKVSQGVMSLLRDGSLHRHKFRRERKSAPIQLSSVGPLTETWSV